MKDMNKKFENVKQELEDKLSYYGELELHKEHSLNDLFAYYIDLNIIPGHLDINIIDVHMKTDGSLMLEKREVGFCVEELAELQKVLSIFYGSPFSLHIDPVEDLEPKYLIHIPPIHLNTLEELKAHIHALKRLLTKVSKALKD